MLFLNLLLQKSCIRTAYFQSEPAQKHFTSNNWSGTGAVLQNQFDTTQPKTATPATVDSVIAYKTSTAFETAYLKKE